MSKIVRFLFICLTAMSLAACHDEDDQPKATHTIIFYMAADNNLSSYAQSDINELKAAMDDIPSDCKIALFCDRPLKGPFIGIIDATNAETVYEYEQPQISTDSATMLSALRHVMQLCPADEYSLVLWSHGSGWIPGTSQKAPRRAFGVDGAVQMDIPVLRGVLEQFAPFQFILFDACFMQSIEVAYELKDVTRWTIGSPAEIPGVGAPYDKIVKALCKKDIAGIVSGYHYPDPDCTPLSAIRTDKLEQLVNATAAILPPHFMGHTTPELTGIQRYCGLYPEYSPQYDIRSAMHHVCDSADYKHWMSSLEAAVPIRKAVKNWTSIKNRSEATPAVHDSLHYSGVSIYLPSAEGESEGFNQKIHDLRWYHAIGWERTGW